MTETFYANATFVYREVSLGTSKSQCYEGNIKPSTECRLK